MENLSEIKVWKTNAKECNLIGKPMQRNLLQKRR